MSRAPWVPNRQPMGIPVGGQFAVAARGDSGDLIAEDEPILVNGRTEQEWVDEYRRHQYDYDHAFTRLGSDPELIQEAALQARTALLSAKLARDGGMTAHRVLLDLRGKVIATESKYNQFQDMYWKLTPEAAKKLGKTYVTSSDALDPEDRRARNRKKGFTMGAVRVKGEVKMIGRKQDGTGYPAIVGDQKVLATGDYEVLTREVIDSE